MDRNPKKPYGTRRERQKAETRDLILESARELFDKLGYEKTTVRAVAQKAGVGLGTIFNHFPDKPSLLIAALLDDLTKVQTDAMKTMPPKAPVCEKFLHLATHFYAYYAGRPSLSRTLLKGAWFTKGIWGQELKNQADRFIDYVTVLLEEAERTGEIRPEADCRLAAMAFFSHYLSVLFFGLGEPKFKPPELIDLLRMALNQLMDGIGSGKKPYR